MMDRATDQRNHNWFAIDRPVIEMGLAPITLSLYVVIAAHVNHKTGTAFPGIGKLCKLLGVGRSTIIRHTKKLEALGLLKVVRETAENGEHKVNHYYLLPVGGSPAQTLPSVSTGPGVVSPQDSNNKNNNNKKEQESENAQERSDEGGGPQVDQDEPIAVTSTAAAPKKASRKKTKVHPVQTISDPNLKEFMDTIGEVFGHHGVVRRQTAHILKCSHTQQPELNLDRPADVDEVRAFGKWYRGKYPDIDMPGKPEKVQSHFLAFRAEAEKKRVAHEARVKAQQEREAAAVPEKTAEQLAYEAEEVRRMKAEIFGTRGAA